MGRSGASNRGSTSHGDARINWVAADLPEFAER